MWSLVQGKFILFTDEEAAKFNGFENDSNRLELRNIGGGHHIVGTQVLETPAFAPITPELMKLPQCRLEEQFEGEGNQILRIKPRSIFEPDNSPRVYTPTGKAFERPPFPPKGDWSEDAIYGSIGRALSSWEHVEIALSDLFTSLLSPNLYELPAQRAFGSVTTSGLRSNMLKEAGDAFFMAFPNDDDNAKFDELRKLARQYAERRNDIAHGIVGPYPTPGGPVRGLALLPPRHATAKRTLIPHDKPQRHPPTDRPNYAYASPEIMFFSAQFYDLSREIHQLALHMYRRFPDSFFKDS